MVNAAATAIDFTGVNAQYGVEVEEYGDRYPAIQATVYQPETINKSVISKMEPGDYVQVDNLYYERPRLGLSESSFEKLPEDQAARLKTIEQSCVFDKKKGEEVIIRAFPDDADIRFVILSKPKIFKLDKETGEISYLQRGDKFAGTKLVTIARLFLSVIVDGEPILNEDGGIQIFTLKLTSNKTALVGRESEAGTIMALNVALQKHFGVKKQWLTHLVGVNLRAVPQQFSNKLGESSTGIVFEMGGAKPLSSKVQEAIYHTVVSFDFKELADDPFGIKSVKPDQPAESKQSESEDAAPVNFDAIPF